MVYLKISDSLDLIMSRQSIRKYKPDIIPKDIISAIILAGTYAPSVLALQPWAFIVIQNMKFHVHGLSGQETTLLSH